MPVSTITSLIRKLSPEARALAVEGDPTDWLLRAAERYAKEQIRNRSRIDTRTSADRRDYMRKRYLRKTGQAE